MARRAWYKSDEYLAPRPPTTIAGDGSMVEVTAPTPDTRVICRVYADGNSQEIHFTIMPGGWRKYTREDIGPAHPDWGKPVAQRRREFDEALANGEVRVLARGPIPGAGMGVTRDENNRRHFHRSEDYERYHDENKLAPAMRSDFSTRHMASDADLDRQMFRDAGLDDAPLAPAVEAAMEQEYRDARLAQMTGGVKKGVVLSTPQNMSVQTVSVSDLP